MGHAVADKLRVVIGLITVLVLSGCGTSSIYTPVDDRSIGKRAPVKVVSSQQRPDLYVVRRGDTLYSISFRYGLDYRTVAGNNGIGPDYAIYPGQKLKLSGGGKSAVAVATLNRTVSQPARPAASSTTPTKSNSSSAKPQTPRKTTSASAKSSAPEAAVAVKTQLNWRWPGNGEVIQRYSNSGKVNKGINLAGNRGDPVLAAEAGRVVYAGSGLLGYGNLVIINHNQQFLSAYAHNSRILVKENDMVKTGEKIAEIGSSGTTRNMLHFEIRRDGKPVDPMKYLPRKR